jgi:hypothetical protein
MKNGKVLCLGIVFCVMLTGGALYGQGTSTNTTAENFTNVGASGAGFQKLWVGARSAAMAGGFSALADDVTALYWNPAGIARLQGISAMASYTRWHSDITHNFVGAVLPVSEKYRMGVGLTVVDYGSLRSAAIQPGASNRDANAGTFNANDLSFGVSIAGALTDRFSFGATVKYLRNAILDLSADGLAFDAGSLYQTDFYKLKISLALTNLGGERNFQGNSLSILARNEQLNTTALPLDARLVTSDFPLPLSFRIGVGTDIFQGEDPDQKLNLDLDFSANSDGPERYNAGAEYVWNDIVAFRAGYAFNHDQMGLGVGAGFKYKSEDFLGQIDYAFNTTKDLGDIHVVSITANFP